MEHIVLRFADVKKATCLSRTTIYQWIKEGTFPRPISLGSKSVGWIESEVEAWIATRMAQRGAAMGATTSSEMPQALEKHTLSVQ